MNSVDICNLALSMLGMPNILSFDDSGNNNAKLCKRFYPILRDRVLRDHTWSFATASIPLVKMAEDSFDPSYPCVCALPGDLIRVITVLPDDAPYRRAGKRLLVRALPAMLVYVRCVEDAEEFDSVFSEALQYLIAVEIGMANTRDAQLIGLYRQEYDKRLAIARSIDSQENIYAYKKAPRNSTWLSARRSGLGSVAYSPLKITIGTEGK